MIYDINGNPLIAKGEGTSQSVNCKIIAHRGYHAAAAQNTIAAFVAAAEAGFRWIEIDIRRCADGIYVMAHDATVTLYNNGTKVSVNVPNSNYKTIKNYTWDAAGKYKLCTLQAVFNAMMIYDINMICDLKNGNNSDIMALAALSGAVDKVLLSYSSFGAAYNDRNLLLKYDNVPIRCIPTKYSEYGTLASAINNPIYADVNASMSTHIQQYLNISLSCGVPVIFSGCTKDNFDKWSVLANGTMANGDLNITYKEFYDLLDNDYDIVCNITPSVNSVSVEPSGSVSLTASSNASTPGGYVYGFVVDPTVAKLTQSAFGQSASFSVAGVAAGNTVLRLFTGSGEIVDIPVIVA